MSAKRARAPEAAPRGRAALIAGGLLAGAVLSEIVLAALGLPRTCKPRTNPPQFMFRIAPDGKVFYTNYPSTVIRFEYDGPPGAVEHTVNSAGFRGGEFAVRKRPGVYRIAFLGDSFTFGEGVRDSATMPERTAALLREKRPGGVESLNFGVGGYDTAQEVDLLKGVVLPTGPDAVVLAVVLNDAEPPLFYSEGGRLLRREREANVPAELLDAPPPEDARLPRVVRLAKSALRARRMNSLTEAYYRSLYASGAPGRLEMERSLREFSSICEARKIRCVVACWPLLHKLRSYPYEELHAAVAGAVRGSARVRFVDLLPFFRGLDESAFWVHPADRHPNERAQEIAAEAVARALSP